MKNNKTVSRHKTLALSLFFALVNIQVFAQGWGFTFLVSGGSRVTNEIVHIPAFSDGVTYPMGFFPTGDNLTFQFSKIEGEEFVGTGSLLSPTGSTSGLDHFPRSSVINDRDTVIVLADQINPLSGQMDIFIHRYHADSSALIDLPGTHDWSKPLFVDPQVQGTGKSLIYTNDGKLLALCAIQSEILPDTSFYELYLVKTDLNGTIEWVNLIQNPGDDHPVQIIAAPDNGFWILGNSALATSPDERTMRLTKTDAQGTQQWAMDLGALNDVAYDMVLTSDGGLVLTGHNANQELLVLKLAANGTPLWRQDYPTSDRSMMGKGIIEDLQLNLIVAGEQQMNADGEIDPFLAKLTATGIPLWEKRYGKLNQGENFNDIQLTPAGQYLMCGYRDIPDNGGRFGYLIKTDTLGVIKGGVVHGNVFHDLNIDCLPDSDEINLEDWKVQVTNDSLNFYGNTDALGNYWIPVQVEQDDTMNYTVSLVPPSSYWAACANDIPVTLFYLDTMTVDFPAQALVTCPFPQVQIGASPLRSCQAGFISIDYCNYGTALAENATLEVILDEYLLFEDATITPSQVDGQIYTFPLGDLAVNECGNLLIDVMVDCDSTQFLDAVCIEAHISPDVLCIDPENWSGALLHLDYTCTDDELRFNIENVGTAPMQSAQSYIIIEDAVLLMQGDFNLNPTESIQSDPIPLDGTIYHFIAPQEPGAPGPEWVSLGTAGCTDNHSPMVNQFPQNSGDPFTVIHCPTIQGPYDPNDKLATPSGTGMHHEILPNTDLQYTIRFQNVGNDTAFRVIIKDTLSELLNPATIVPGPSSHPYTWRLEDRGVMTFNFYDINLPDSTTNLAGSQGFVNFRIKQKRDLEVGSVIENSAGIYFDFNAPIITNTTFHTISDLMEIVNGSVAVADPVTAVKVVPNPMQNGAWIQIEGLEMSQNNLTLTLYDITGKRIRTLTGNGPQFWIDRGSLVSGMYFFTIEGAGQWQASGKLMVQ